MDLLNADRRIQSATPAGSQVGRGFRWQRLIVAGIILTTSGCGLVVLDGRITTSVLEHRSGFEWCRDSSEHFYFYVESGSWAYRHLDTVKSDAERSLRRCLSLVRQDDFEGSIYYYIVEDRDRMDDLIFRKTNGQSFPARRIVCAIASDSIQALGPHEIFHVVSFEGWGGTREWFSEGMAVYANDSWWRQDLHALCNYFRIKGKLVPLRDLSDRFHTFDDMISYPEAGCVVKYLYERFGADGMKIAWSKGIDSLCASANISFETMEQDWLNEISRSDVSSIHYIPLE